MELKVELNEKNANGDHMEETLILEDKVPAKIGRKTRMKINAEAEGNENEEGEIEEEYVIKDAVSTIEKVKMYLVDQMLQYSNADVDINDLTLNSYDEVASLYWPQIQGKKKVSDSESEAESETT